MTDSLLKFRFWDQWNQHMTYSKDGSYEELLKFFNWANEADKANNGIILMQWTGAQAFGKISMKTILSNAAIQTG